MIIVMMMIRTIIYYYYHRLSLRHRDAECPRRLETADRDDGHAPCSCAPRMTSSGAPRMTSSGQKWKAEFDSHATMARRSRRAWVWRVCVCVDSHSWAGVCVCGRSGRFGALCRCMPRLLEAIAMSTDVTRFARGR